jgi:hypothetical protein
LLDQPLAITKVNASGWYGTVPLPDDALRHVPGVPAQNRAGWATCGWSSAGTAPAARTAPTRASRACACCSTGFRRPSRRDRVRPDRSGEQRHDVIRSARPRLGQRGGRRRSISTVRGGTALVHGRASVPAASGSSGSPRQPDISQNSELSFS